MTTVGLISDTHGYWDESYAHHFSDCQVIWHLGDIGNPIILEKLSNISNLIAVRGNIDSLSQFSQVPEYQIINLEQMIFLLIHIAGPFGRFTPQLLQLISKFKPHAIACGHSHICKVQFIENSKLALWYINPGAAGHHGFHHMRTLLKMAVHEDRITSMQVIELGKRGSIK